MADPRNSGNPPVTEQRHTVKPRLFWRQFLPFRRMWCRQPNPTGEPWNKNGNQCRFRFGHPFAHEDHMGRSW
jgi:hypothetical protein